MTSIIDLAIKLRRVLDPNVFVEDNLNRFILTPAIPTSLANLTDDPTHRVVSDTEKATWNDNQLAIPIGGIVGWTGKVLTIPTNFRLCNGTGGTPDLSAMFI